MKYTLISKIVCVLRIQSVNASPDRLSLIQRLMQIRFDGPKQVLIPHIFIYRYIGYGELKCCISGRSVYKFLLFEAQT